MSKVAHYQAVQEVAPRRGPVRGADSPTQQVARRRARIVAIAPLATVLVVLTIVPTLYLVVISLTNYAATNPGTTFVGLANYTGLFTDPGYWAVMARTLVFVVAAVGIQLALGIAMAVATSKLTKGASLIRGIILLPMASAPIAMLFNWRQIANVSYGPVNYILELLGLPPVDFLGDSTLAMATLVMVDVWQWTPFVFIIVAGGLATIPKDVYEAASVDGANGWKSFVHITLPLLMPYISVATLFRTIDALKTFDSVQVLTSGGPGSSTTMLNYSIFQQAINFLNFGKGAASAVIFLAVCIFMCNLLLRSLSRKEAS